MAVPDYQSLMHPILRTLEDGYECHVHVTRERVAELLELSSEDRNARLKSGNQTVLANRISWALLYMRRAGLVERIRQGTNRLTRAGRQLLSTSVKRVDLRTLRTYPTFVEWIEKTRNDHEENDESTAPVGTEEMGHGIQASGSDTTSSQPLTKDRMSVPDFQSLMLPTLKTLSDGTDFHVQETRDQVARALDLSDEAINKRIKSGQTVLANRVGWALTYMRQAGLVERVSRGVNRVTTAGSELLSKHPERIDVRSLSAYPNFDEWRKKTVEVDRGPTEPDSHQASSETPDDLLERAAAQLSAQVQGELLERVRKVPPAFFEQVVLNLMTAMGYGGGDPAMAHATGGPGDGGIDGTIREDQLGLDEVYVQAKRYTDHNPVGSNAIQNFAGAIDAAGTTKGIFVTTSKFTRNAQDYVNKSPKRIVLVDGQELARLMEKYNVGVRGRAMYEVKGIDEGYFDEIE